LKASHKKFPNHHFQEDKRHNHKKDKKETRGFIRERNFRIKLLRFFIKSEDLLKIVSILEKFSVFIAVMICYVTKLVSESQEDFADLRKLLEWQRCAFNEVSKARSC
jgi:hypothetical protein